MVESPRKRLKRVESPSDPVSIIPESPVSKSDNRNHNINEVNRASPSFGPAISHNGVNTSPQIVPSRPNVPLRKGGFPSQAQNGAQRMSQATTGSKQSPIEISQSAAYGRNQSEQQMRQHAAGFQYQVPQSNYPQHAPQYVRQGSSTGGIAQANVNQQGSNHMAHAYSSVNNFNNSQSYPGNHSPAVGTSMANPYLVNNRPRPRLVQRPDLSQQPSGAQYNVPVNTYQNNYHPGYMQQLPMSNPYAQPMIGPEAIKRLADVFPHLPDVLLRKALSQARGNIQDAQALIADDRVKFDIADNNLPYNNDHDFRDPGSYQGYNMYNQGMPANRVLPASSKREIKAPNLSIREKQALRTAQTYTGYNQQAQPYGRYDNPYNTMQAQNNMHFMQQQQRQMQQQNYKHSRVVTPAVYEAPKLRTRAVRKGPKIDIASDESEEDAAVEIESEDPGESDVQSDDEDEPAQETIPYLDFDRVALESRVLHYFNTVETPKELADLASCTEDIARMIIDARPFQALDEVQNIDQLPEGKRPSRTRKTVGSKAVEMSLASMEGYEAIDSLVARCEEYGTIVKDSIAQWGINIANSQDEDGALAVTKVDVDTKTGESEIEYLKDQPALLPESVRLKDYQLFGVNWLHLMYQKKLSGILADEMGLGKTCQVISFLGILLGRGLAGPHLIVVPASTLENWLREISRFCPALKVEAYYGSQRERNEFRDQFEGEKRDFNIMVTTYQLATGAKDDRTFLKKQAFDVCVYDEGHNLKNSSSSRYKYLMALKANFRVLLTGTPLQNNLKELISLLSFVLPKVFAGNIERLDSIFKIKSFGDTDSLESALLSQERIKRAKTMMTPFILRRFKKDVLEDLPEKRYRIDYVELNQAQKAIYNENLATTRKALEEKSNGAEILAKDVKSAVNVMMQLRKCSNHPMLFRRQYTDKILKKMAKAILKEETFKDSNEDLVIEDMEVMTDFELNRLCLRYEKIQQFALDQDCWMDACKVEHLQKILPEMKKNGDRILLFSQFTQTLDILEDCMDTMGITYFRLDGSTNVSARQDLIDQFHEETDITVFLLSTKAGGFGINLACANVVIIYDSSFNPHDDKQAEDRAHRVGQKRTVQIIRLVAKDTIEEHIARLANTKLTLDSSISGDLDAENKAIEEQGEKKVAQTLLSQLKAQE